MPWRWISQSQADDFTADQSQGDNITADQSQVDNITRHPIHKWTISQPIAGGQYHSQSQGDNITADQSQVDNITADQSQVDNISGLLAWGEGLKKSVFFLKTSLNQLNTVFLNYSTERTVS